MTFIIDNHFNSCNWGLAETSWQTIWGVPISVYLTKAFCSTGCSDFLELCQFLLVKQTLRFHSVESYHVSAILGTTPTWCCCVSTKQEKNTAENHLQACALRSGVELGTILFASKQIFLRTLTYSLRNNFFIPTTSLYLYSPYFVWRQKVMGHVVA